jgi:hypothetical protein
LEPFLGLYFLVLIIHEVLVCCGGGTHQDAGAWRRLLLVILAELVAGIARACQQDDLWQNIFEQADDPQALDRVTSMAAQHVEKTAIIQKAIRGIPDFPKKGILFYDITTLLLNPTAFQYVTDIFVERYRNQPIDVVAGWGTFAFCVSCRLGDLSILTLLATENAARVYR